MNKNRKTEKESRADQNRKTAFLVLRDVESKDAYSNLALNQYIREEQPDAPAFVRELVYGVLERKLTLDHIIRQQLKDPKSRLRPADRVLLRMGLYQMLYLDSVPDYAAVDGCVRLAKVFCRGREGFINGVLRGLLKCSRIPNRISDLEKTLSEPEALSVAYSYSPQIAELWLAQYGRETAERMMAAGNERPRLAVRANTLKIRPQELERQLCAQGFSAQCLSETEYWPQDIFRELQIGSQTGKLPPALFVSGNGLLEHTLYKEGYFSVQSQSSMLAVAALDPQPGETVLDVCAAPGGKSLFAAELMQNRGLVSARDIYGSRLELLRADAERLGIHIIETKEFDLNTFRSKG